jgi:hypothetical protein
MLGRMELGYRETKIFAGPCFTMQNQLELSGAADLLRDVFSIRVESELKREDRTLQNEGREAVKTC